MNNINKEENDNSLRFKGKKMRFSISNEASDNQCSSSKLVIKNFNYTEVYPIKNKNINKKRSSKFKLDQSKLDQVPNIKKHLSKPNIFPTIKYLNKSNHISNIKSPKMNRHSSIKTLEKDIQQKIIDISMKIEQEISDILGEPNNNKNNLSTFIKKKIGSESEFENSSFLSKNKIIQSYKRHKSFTGKNLKFEQLAEGINFNNKSHCISNSKFRKTKKEAFRRLFQKKIVYDSFD